MDVEPDWNVHAFQKAQTIQGQPTSVATEYIIRMLGLDICADTICGNHMMRGISGGQKKRVTSGVWATGSVPGSSVVHSVINVNGDMHTGMYAWCKLFGDDIVVAPPPML